MFKSNPRLLNCCRDIPLANHQYELARPVNNDIRDVYDLELGIRCSGDVGELEKFFEMSAYGALVSTRLRCQCAPPSRL